MMIKIYEGTCAIKIGKYWVGASSKGYSKKRRRTVEKALEDAEKICEK